MVRWWLATSFAVCLAHAAHEHHREDALHGHGAHHEGHDEHEAHRHGHGHKAHSHGEVPPAASPSPAGLRSFLSWLTAQPWWVSAYVCAFGMSIISFAGAALMIPLQVRRIAAMVEYSSLTFAATVLVADALVHLLPHALEGADHETMTTVGIAATAGCLAIMSIPELVEWHHGHRHEKKSAEDAEGQEPHVHAYGIANLVTEMLHNFVDGIGLGMAWRAGAPSGWATALAVAVHELPQEIGDFMVLRAAGFPVGQLLGWNFLASLTCLGGVGLVHVLGQTDWAAVVQRYTTAFTAGSFLALALNMVFPQVSQTIHQHHPSAVARFWANLLCLAISVAAIWTLVWIGEFEGGHEHGHGASHGHAHGHEL